MEEKVNLKLKILEMRKVLVKKIVLFREGVETATIGLKII